MVYLINVLIMRSFAYKNENFIKNEVVPELVEDNPCYQQSVYDSVMYDETPYIVTGKQIGRAHV